MPATDTQIDIYTTVRPQSATRRYSQEIPVGSHVQLLDHDVANCTVLIKFQGCTRVCPESIIFS